MDSADVCSMLLGLEPSMKFRLTGRSMEPFLMYGETVVCRASRRLVVGKCYFFRFEGRVLLHRLIAIHGDAALLMGDNSESIEIVNTKDIIAELEDTTMLLKRFGAAVINRLYLWCAAASGAWGGTKSFAALRRKLLAILFRRSRMGTANAAIQ